MKAMGRKGDSEGRLLEQTATKRLAVDKTRWTAGNF
jgi:hypothetical protein